MHNVRVMRAFIRQHAALCYFTLAFAISWGGILAIVGGGPIPATPDDAVRLFTPVYLAMLAGPSIAGVAITGVVGGATGLRNFGGRLRAWRVAPRWYAAALLPAPLAIGATLCALSQFSDSFVPAILQDGAAGSTGPVRAESWQSFLAMGLAVGAGAGFFEELGWTGVAGPTLRARHGIVATGVTVGVLWGAWHFLAIYWGSVDMFGAVPVWLHMVVVLFSFLVPYRVLMTFVYEHTRSLLVAVLMHASLTASMLLLGAPVTGGALLTYDLVLGAVLWVLVIVVVSARRDPARFSPPPSARTSP